MNKVINIFLLFNLLALTGCSVNMARDSSTLLDSFSNESRIYTIEEIEGHAGYFRISENQYIAQFPLTISENEPMRKKFVYPYLFRSAAELSVRDGFEVFKLIEIADIKKTFSVLITMYENEKTLPWEQALSPWFFAKDYIEGYSIPRSPMPNEA